MVARDLEVYNKNRNFNNRARSMLVQAEGNEVERNFRSLEPPSAQLRVGHEVDISR